MRLTATCWWVGVEWNRSMGCGNTEVGATCIPRPPGHTLAPWLAAHNPEPTGDKRLRATQERQVRFVLSCMRYLKHAYGLGSSRSSGSSSSSGGTRSNGVGGPWPHAHLPGTHPGMLLLGHSFGGVLARAAMVAAVQEEGLGGWCMAWLPLSEGCRCVELEYELSGGGGWRQVLSHAVLSCEA